MNISANTSVTVATTTRQLTFQGESYVNGTSINTRCPTLPQSFSTKCMRIRYLIYLILIHLCIGESSNSIYARYVGIKDFIKREQVLMYDTILYYSVGMV